jgi:hypothetical protein
MKYLFVFIALAGHAVCSGEQSERQRHEVEVYSLLGLEYYAPEPMSIQN